MRFLELRIEAPIGHQLQSQVVSSELVGHARLDQTRRYTLPSDEDRRRALDLLPVDR